MRSLSEVLLAARYDTVEYVCKAVGLLDPVAPSDYWLHQLVGELPAVALVVALVTGAVWRLRSQKLGLAGLVAFVCFLLPPLVTRATVSVVNMPTLRQSSRKLLAARRMLTSDAW